MGRDTVLSAPAATEPLRVLQLTAPAAVGGLERVVHSLACGLGERGHDVTVAAVVEAAVDHPFLLGLRDGAVRTEVLAGVGRAYRREYGWLRGLMRTIRPDIVHTHGYRSDVIGSLAARHAGIPVVTTSHGFCYGDWKNRLYEWVQRRSFRRFDAVVAVSRVMRDGLQASGVPTRVLRTIPNGFAGTTDPLDRAAARAALGLSSGGFHIGWVGRFDWAKGVDLFVSALAQLRELSWTASIVGTGSAAATARALAVQLGVDDRIRWHGSVENAARYLSAFDALVISSRTEGTPITLLEAMYAGVPIVTTGVGGIPDVVRAQEAVIAAVDPAALAEGIAAVAGDPEAAQRRAAAARRRLDAFSIHETLAAYEALYRELRAARSRGARRGSSSSARYARSIAAPTISHE